MNDRDLIDAFIREHGVTVCPRGAFTAEVPLVAARRYRRRAEASPAVVRRRNALRVMAAEGRTTVEIARAIGTTPELLRHDINYLRSRGEVLAICPGSRWT